MSFPMPPDVNQNKNYNPDESAHYPKFSEVHKYPDPYKNVGQRINTNPKKYVTQKEQPKYKPKVNPNQKVNKHKHHVKKVPVPVTKYVAVPVGPPMLVPVITQGLAPVYPQPQPQIQPQQMVYPPPPQYGNYNYGVPPNYYYDNNVRVIPPGYHRDYTAGYSPLGDFIDDIQNLF